MTTSAFIFGGGNAQGSNNSSGGANPHGSSSQTADLLKIIDDYSRQNEGKTKEIDTMAAKLDRKLAKVNDLKKKHSESEIKVVQLKSALHNVKKFLMMLNSNFISSMKQQNAALKESIAQSEADMAREINAFKESVGPYIVRVVSKQERELGSQITQLSNKNQELSEQIARVKVESESKIVDMKTVHQ